jgi:hypothetical protein
MLKNKLINNLKTNAKVRGVQSVTAPILAIREILKNLAEQKEYLTNGKTLR